MTPLRWTEFATDPTVLYLLLLAVFVVVVVANEVRCLRRRG